jgi:uncharacterized protein with ATP-grasp and redox domains
MKVGARCGYCLLHRGYQQILRSTDDETVRREAIGALLHLIADMYGNEAVPSIIGAERDRLLHRITGCPDPYAELKKQANRAALEVLPSFEALVAAQPEAERLRKAALIACLGNIIEYDVPGHSADVGSVLENIESEGFTIDDIESFQELLGPDVELLYLTDNAGEIAFDRLLVRELRRLGCRVAVAVKGGPSLNDALMGDAEAVGMVGEADLVITTGTDAVGVNLSEVSEEFLDVYRSADVILAKGMANWETLTEYEAPCFTLFLFRAKCEPVAVAVGVPLRENVAKLVPQGWRL